MPLLRRLLRAALIVPIALILLFEEWGWEPLSRLLARLARLPVWSALEKKITHLPPWAAMLVFAVPALALLPVKLLAIFLFGRGHGASGVLLLLAAKLAGTAVVARLFQLTQPALMQIDWFARWYPRWKNWKDTWLERVRQSAAWRVARQIKNAAASIFRSRR